MRRMSELRVGILMLVLGGAAWCVVAGAAAQEELGVLGGPQTFSYQKKCPNAELKQNFDIDRFLGVWYEIQSQESPLQKIKTCHKSTYYRTDSGVQVKSQGLDKHKKYISTLTNLTFTENPAVFTTDFIGEDIPVPLEVVDTDYESYACIHSCVAVASIVEDMIFVYARKRRVTLNLINNCLKLYYEYPGMAPWDMFIIPQYNC